MQAAHNSCKLTMSKTQKGSFNTLTGLDSAIIKL